jgi:hypothetical protein
VSRRSIGNLRACAVLVGLTGLVVACSDDASVSSAEEYCGLVTLNQAALTSPSVATPVDVAATLAVYDELAAAAPLAIAPEWTTLADAVRTASTVVPGDSASVQRAADTARAAEPAARSIIDYTASTCGISLPTPG